MPGNVMASEGRAAQQLLLVDKATVEALLAPAAVIEAVREAFVLHAERRGRVFPVLREALPSGGIFGIKAGDVADAGLFGFKAAGFWPQNRARGGEPHQATIVLIDPDSGRPQAIIDGNAITTLRTGAAGGLGLRHLARRDSRRAVIFGTGVQARIQLSFALDLMPSLAEISYISGNDHPDRAFESLFAGRCDLSHRRDRNQAVATSDVVITATPGGGPLFDDDAVAPGTHVTCVGADTTGKRELPEGLLARCRLIVDDQSQAARIGEMQWAPTVPAIAFGDILAGSVNFERAPDDITVFDMTGLALQDLTVGRLVFERALTAGLGVSVPWPW